MFHLPVGGTHRTASVGAFLQPCRLVGCGGEKGATVAVEAIPCLLGQTEKGAVGRLTQVANAVGRHGATVARPRLEIGKFEPVETVEAVPGCHPHHAVLVLQHLRDAPLRQA